MRKLATIERVLNLTPIPDSNKIELAQILGWKVVVERGLYNIGDLCVYI